MKYSVIYSVQKTRKLFKKQVATFYNLEDAARWEKHVIEQGHQNVEIRPVF